MELLLVTVKKRIQTLKYCMMDRQIPLIFFLTIMFKVQTFIILFSKIPLSNRIQRKSQTTSLKEALFNDDKIAAYSNALQ